jgi:diguanylate cyclase (GGDEF)-like protein
LFNRRFLDETLNREIERSARRGATLGLIVLDIDHFKTLNDTCGHAAGDTVLRTLGGYLQKHLRSEDIACRYGGDEFLLVLPETPPETVLALAEDICSGARALKPRPTGRAFPTVSLSVGVATYPKHGMTAESLVLSADQALYAAKRGGRNRVCSAGESAA